ncbi:MAG: glycoside hydrolase family 127 protein [Ruminococcaceae bacterium]|nr:glycoside hydrolase family 127 protein [Oscillospiraceae bacterium]
MDTSVFSKHIESADIVITDSFWKEKLELVRKEVIPYQYEALHDRIEGADKSYSVENFIKAGKIAEKIRNGEKIRVYPTDKWCYDEGNSHPDSFHGWVFQDSDVYKWLEAVGFSLINYPDKDLENKADAIIDIVCDAQLENGYLDTLFIINDRDAVFTNLKDWHELYCFGHLAEAAVAYYKATGKTKLLDTACRFADLICDTFGENKIKGYPGHEIAEMALVKLYEITNNERYLDTARFFIDERGKKPYYYDTILGKETVYDNYHYNQAHIQPKYQSEAVGHAVRGVYLYSGMADIAKYCKDDELYNACLKLCDNIINKKMYITGGIGATVDGEAFSFDYDLPNDLAYSETCASIGLIFFLRRMLEISPDAVFGDTVERALYNTVLSGMAVDGKSFFYVNPLEVLPEASRKDSRKRHIKPVRQKWFGCACCPPNLARLISSVGEYAFAENEDTVFVHQYIGSLLKTKNAEIEIVSDYLDSGEVTLKITPQKEFTLALRIPLWCKEYCFTETFEEKNGYAYFKIKQSCEIKASYSLYVRMIKCSNKVRSNLDKVAITRGPFVYCAEEVDNGKELQMLKISKMPDFDICDDILYANAFREKESKKLYGEWAESEYVPVRIKLIPYYKWANRGENEMSVYIRI